MGSVEKQEPFEERHFTVPELSAMWRLSREFVRQVVQHEPGVTEWVRQQPGKRRYRVLRVPQSVAERLYHRALGRAEDEAAQTAAGTWDNRLRSSRATSRSIKLKSLRSAQSSTARRRSQRRPVSGQLEAQVARHSQALGKIETLR